jgi:hypothetical protein
MRDFRIKWCVFILSLLFISFSCRKNKETLSIILYDKPLNVIQTYIKGNWKLKYAYGGLSTHKYIDKYNSYMILSPDHIILGNDSTGIVVDTNIVWIRSMARYEDSTYILSYSWSGYLWPEHYLVDQIKSDTLIIIDYVNDGYSYFYIK